MADCEEVGLCTCPGCEWAYYLYLDKSKCHSCHAAPTLRLNYVFDTYVVVTASSKEEADAKLEEIERAVEAAGGGLSVFPAYGIEDAETGEEIRPVG